MIFETVDDQWTVRVASEVKKACTLIEAGFEYVTEEYADGSKIFRKRKYVESCRFTQELCR